MLSLLIPIIVYLLAVFYLYMLDVSEESAWMAKTPWYWILARAAIWPVIAIVVLALLIYGKITGKTYWD